MSEVKKEGRKKGNVKEREKKTQKAIFESINERNE